MNGEEHKTILLVEDEAIVVMEEARTLEKNGYKVITVSSGKKAIKTVETNPDIDLILMDINLGGGMDGTEAAEKILGKHDLPLIFLSSYTEREVVEKTEGITSYGYIVKNSGEPVLMASIKMAFRLFEAKVKKRAKSETLQVNEYYLKEAQAIAQVGHWNLDPQTRKVEGSDELFRIFDLNQEHGSTLEAFIEVVHPDDKEFDLYHIKRGMEQGESWDIEHRIICRDGTEKWIRAKGEAVTDKSGAVIELIGTVQDITESKRIEKKLLESEDKFSRIFNAAPILITISKLKDGEYIDVNKTFLSVTGYGREEVIGHTSTELKLFTTGDRDRLKQLLKKQGLFHNEEFDIQIKNGTIINTFFSAQFIDLAGEQCIISVAENITVRKRAEEMLKKEKWLSEEYINSLPGLFYVFDEERLVKWNKQWEIVTGYSADELGKMYGPDFFHGSDKTLILERMKEVFSKGVSEAQASIITKKGEQIPYYFNGLRKEFGGKPHLVGLGIDITELKQVEEALRDSKQLLSESQESANIGSWMWDLKSGIADWSEQFYKIYGRDPDLGVPPMDSYLEAYHPDDREPLQNAIEKTINEDSSYNIDYRILREDNGEERWIRSQGKLEKDDKGKPNRLIGIAQDITERKQAEKKIENLLREKEALLKEVHHRIKNNMNVVRSLLSLQSQTLDNPEAVTALQDAIGRIESMGVLYDKLYTTESYQDVSIKEYLTQLINEIFQMFPDRQKIKIKTKINDFIIGTKVIFPLGIIVNELLTNAMKYAFTGRESGLIQLSAVLKGNHATIIFEDNGVGMPELKKDEHQKGFGIKLIGFLTEQIKGSYNIETNKGTKFIIEFDI